MCKLFLGTRKIPSKDSDEEKLLTLDLVGLMVCGIFTTSPRSWERLWRLGDISLAKFLVTGTERKLHIKTKRGILDCSATNLRKLLLAILPRSCQMCWVALPSVCKFKQRLSISNMLSRVKKKSIQIKITFQQDEIEKKQILTRVKLV